jgi:hypothetical protein
MSLFRKFSLRNPHGPPNLPKSLGKLPNDFGSGDLRFSSCLGHKLSAVEIIAHAGELPIRIKIELDMENTVGTLLEALKLRFL